MPLSASCSDPVGPKVILPNVSACVTPQLRTLLDAQGVFVLEDSMIGPADSVVSESEGRELAFAYLRTFAHDRSFWQPLELQHGGRIAITSMEATTRVELAHSPYDTVPPEASPSLRRSLAPSRVVRLLAHGVPAAMVSVSTRAHELRIQDGMVIFSNMAGGEFQAFGMRPDAGFSAPIGPERAARAAANATGALVAGVPALLKPDRRFAMTFARWRVALDRPVSFREVVSGQIRTSSDVYVGMLPVTGVPGGVPEALYLPALAQPETDTVSVNPAVIVAIRAGVPVRFEVVEPSAPQHGSCSEP
jgi:hypothetical protein